MPVSAALIGCGRIGFLLENDPLRKKPCTHLGGMKAAGVSIRAACDVNPERLDLFARKTGLKSEALFSDYHELLKSRRFDIVTIAVPTPLHSKITVAAAESGAAVIVCEKPIAHTILAGKRMIDACRSSGSRLVINHERRFDNKYRKAKELIDSGVIGDIYSIKGFLPSRGLSGVRDASLGGGPLLHDGTHLVDIIAFFAGDFIRVDGRIRRKKRKGFEDYACAILETKSGITAYVEAGGPASYFGFEVIISGSRGRIEIGNGFARLFTAGKSKLYTGFMDLAEKPFPKTAAESCFSVMYREISRKKGLSLSSGENGLRVLKVIHGIYQSAYTGKASGLPNRINIKKIFAL